MKLGLPSTFKKEKDLTMDKDKDKDKDKDNDNDNDKNYPQIMSSLRKFTLLDDPAFSSDPRLHPHFALNDLPSHSPHHHLRPASVHPPTHVPRSSPAIYLPTSHQKCNVSPPQKLKKNPVDPLTIRFDTIPVHVHVTNNRSAAKIRMKNFMQRLTSSHALDRVDKMDETDPFGTGWHHGGPYEAIRSNLAQLGAPHMYKNDIDVRENVSLPLPTQKSPQVPQIGFIATSQSLRLFPGQISSSSPAADIISSPPHVTQANTLTPIPSLILKPGLDQTGPTNSRSRSLPPSCSINHPERLSSSLTLTHAPASHSSPSPRIHQLSNHPHSDELCPLHQIQSAPDPPPGHNEQYPETVLSSRGDANQATRIPSLPIVEPPNAQGIHLSPRHHSTQSFKLVSPRTTTSTQSTGTQTSLKPPRNHHLPKRLVMPAPLQQQQHVYSPTDSYARVANPNTILSPKSRTYEPSAMYNQGRKLHRKKPAVFIPLSTHEIIAYAKPIPPLKKHLSMSVAERKKVDEEVYQRKLGKRKLDA